MKKCGNKGVNGIDEKEIKLTSFADDLTTFLKDKDSLHKLLHKLKLFVSCSGLKPNIAKTEVLRLGPSQKDVDIYSILKIPKPSEPPKILVVYFTWDNRLRDRFNFENLIKSVKKLLAQWRRRNLIIVGKIQVIKSLIIPKFLYRLINTAASETIVKEINKLMFNFIWNGQDKIKRLAIINDKGATRGFKMTHLESAIEDQRILFLKRYGNNENRSWKNVLDSCLKYVGGSFLLKCNFDVISVHFLNLHCQGVFIPIRYVSSLMKIILLKFKLSLANKYTKTCDQEHIRTNKQGQVYSYLFRKQFGLGKYL